jgi:transposase InsO family protein
LHKACAQIGLSTRTVQRWHGLPADQGDRRACTLGARTAPPNKLSPCQRDAAMRVLNCERFKDLSPSQIVPLLADEGQYVASESTLYRLLRAAGQMTHRAATRTPRKLLKPRALVATRPDRIYCWDITYLPTDVRGMYFYLYLYVDIFSRKIVGWQVHDTESADQAAQLLRDVCLRQGVRAGQLVVHSDNGSPMKGQTMLAAMQSLGVAHSRSRPSVSNDNAFSESLFRTLKYRPHLPLKAFASLLQARCWVAEFVAWYNDVHRHSGIGFVTPSQRHGGTDRALLEKRALVYEAARARHPNRWSGPTRDWRYVEHACLNPEKPKK